MKWGELKLLGLSIEHPFHVSWHGMKARCTNPKRPDYFRYGGRGISYDPTWEDFQRFYLDMWPTWEEGLTLDRVDNSLGYSKDNCRWVSNRENCQNQRTTILTTEKVTAIRNIHEEGQSSYTSLAKQFGVSKGTIADVIKWRTWR